MKLFFVLLCTFPYIVYGYDVKICTRGDVEGYACERSSGTYISGREIESMYTCVVGHYLYYIQEFAYRDYGGNIYYSLRKGCVACEPGKYCLGGSSLWQLCSAGTYTAITGLSVCTSCSIGTYAATTGKTMCMSCSAGTYASTTGLPVCMSCSAGTYASTTGLTVCTSCSVGTYAATTGLFVCTSCSMGTYSITVGSSQSSQCIECRAATYTSNMGASVCTACSMGTYSTMVGSSSSSYCTQCSINTYNDINTGASTCKNCASGSYSKPDFSGCAPRCTNGFVVRKVGISVAYTNKCRVNASNVITYSPSIVLYECNPDYIMASFTFSSTTTSGCVTCNPGYYFNVGMVNDVDFWTCKPCPAGMYTDKKGSTGCLPCRSGTYAGSTGMSLCTVCT